MVANLKFGLTEEEVRPQQAPLVPGDSWRTPRLGVCDGFQGSSLWVTPGAGWGVPEWKWNRVVLKLSGDDVSFLKLVKVVDLHPRGKQMHIYTHKYNLHTNFVAVHWPPSLLTEYPRWKNSLTEEIRELKGKIWALVLKHVLQICASENCTNIKILFWYPGYFVLSQSSPQFV